MSQLGFQSKEREVVAEPAAGAVRAERTTRAGEREELRDLEMGSSSGSSEGGL